MRTSTSKLLAFAKARRKKAAPAKRRARRGKTQHGAELDALSHAFTGRPFGEFVRFAKGAQKKHGYKPSIVPRGSGVPYRVAAARLADALELQGVHVWRGPATGKSAPAKRSASKKSAPKKRASKSAARPKRKALKGRRKTAPKTAARKAKRGLASLPTGFLRRIAAANGPKAAEARRLLARRP